MFSLYQLFHSTFITTGKSDYQRKGCYQERAEGDTSNWFNTPQLLFNHSDEARTRYNDWNVYMPELVCRCAEETKKAKFTHFAIKDLGVCVSGISVSDYYNKVSIYLVVALFKTSKIL